MADIDLNKESDPERLRQIAILQEAEIGQASRAHLGDVSRNR
jgi:hypothetical protein